MTWDPGSSEVIRIHMVPPRFLPFRKVPSIAILNGQELLPVFGHVDPVSVPELTGEFAFVTGVISHRSWDI